MNRTDREADGLTDDAVPLLPHPTELSRQSKIYTLDEPEPAPAMVNSPHGVGRTRKRKRGEI